MSLERYTVSSRRVSVLLMGALAVTAGTAALAASRPAAGPGGPAARPAVTAAAAQDEAGAPTAAQGARPELDRTPDGEVLAADGLPAAAEAVPDRPGEPVATQEAIDAQRDAAEVAQAQQVAADFAAGYATYRWDDPPDAAAERIRDHVTPQLAEQLSQAQGGAAGREQLAERQQTAEAMVQSVQTQTLADGWMDLLVVVRQTVTTTSGSETRWPSYLLRVERIDQRWLVSGFQP